MRLKIAFIITGISIVLLLVYGSDAIFSIGKSQGFIPLDVKTRGVVLGFPSVMLPIISYVITKNRPSKTLGTMIIISGVLMFSGSAVFIGLQDDQTVKDPSQFRNGISFLGVVLAGIVISILGALKIRSSKHH